MSTGIPLTSFLNKLKSALLKSSICSLLLSFLTPCRTSHPTSCRFTHPQPILPCYWIADIVIPGWPPVGLFQEVIPDALQKPPVLLMFHTSLPVDVRKVKLLCEKQGLFFRPLPQTTGSSLSIIHPTEEILIPRLILHSESKPPTSSSCLPVSRGEPVRAHGSHPWRAGWPTTSQLFQQHCC